MPKTATAKKVTPETKTMERGKANVPALVQNTARKLIGIAGGKQFTVKRMVTLPLLKHADGATVFIRIKGAIFVGKQIKTEGKANEKPADLVNVVELHSGRDMQYIVSAIVKSNLIELYPDDSYIDRCFAIRKGETIPGKRYKGFEILEIEDNGETE